MARALLIFVIAIHAVIALTNLFAIIVLPFFAPWYISVPLLTFMINLSFNESQCILTKLEDSIRRRSGRPEIYHFTAHYFLFPIRNWLKRIKRLFKN